MIARLRTYNTLRATVGPCDAYRMACMHEQAQQADAQRAKPQQPRGVPIELDGPYHARRSPARTAITAAIALCVLVLLPVLTVVLRAAHS